MDAARKTSIFTYQEPPHTHTEKHMCPHTHTLTHTKLTVVPFSPLWACRLAGARGSVCGFIAQRVCVSLYVVWSLIPLDVVRFECVCVCVCVGVCVCVCGVV